MKKRKILMQWISQFSKVKILLVLLALCISTVFLVSSHLLVKDLSNQEKVNMSIWAEAMRTFNHADENTDLSLVLQVLNSNQSIPVIVLDSQGAVQTYRNITVDAATEGERTEKLQEMARLMKDEQRMIRINLDMSEDSGQDADFIEICYDESILLKRLSAYPYVQLAVVLVFFAVVLLALLSSKKAEQNKVWVGLSKETAHQLGTPISSLMAWVEILRENYPQDDLIPEMNKDVERLQVIAERFSKIGSRPELKEKSLVQVIQSVIQYIGVRASSKIKIQAQLPANDLKAHISAPLFEWVIENLCKNAIDAIDGEGSITVSLKEAPESYLIDVTDTGKGVAKKNFKAVFRPGFTTKKRGWGLGLSLAKRIIEEYHQGKIYIKKSELGVGTTFRIELKKS